MAYQTGSASGQDDLLDKLRLFLVANGWTTNMWQTDGDGYRLHVQKGTQYVNFRSTATDPSGTDNTGGHIWLCGSEGYDSGEDWDAQPNASDPSLLRDVATVANYYVFLDGDCCYVVVEVTVGIFRHMAFGIIEKNGLAAGQSGAFVGAVYLSPGSSSIDATSHALLFDSNERGALYRNWFRLDIDGDTGLWVRNTYNTSVSPRVIGTCRKRGMNWDLVLAQPNTFNQSTTLLPMYLMAYRGSDLYSLIGYPPNIAQCEMNNYMPGDEIVIGSDTWVIFPWYQRASTLSAYHAYAFKKVT